METLLLCVDLHKMTPRGDKARRREPKLHLPPGRRGRKHAPSLLPMSGPTPRVPCTSPIHIFPRYPPHGGGLQPYLLARSFVAVGAWTLRPHER
ncbi:hypothetical protein CRG98_016379 [Punica granatum]|uniref:Uncharacterized protein n=1 Tax=Punica granatum TaxID=22663 RepID=A0A2I0K3S9_PUNGR|nr:hypothetical protein CRG98_016379 [Punica granatum]